MVGLTQAFLLGLTHLVAWQIVALSIVSEYKVMLAPWTLGFGRWAWLLLEPTCFVVALVLPARLCVVRDGVNFALGTSTIELSLVLPCFGRWWWWRDWSDWLCLLSFDFGFSFGF